jgi:hypothetical protein
MVGAILAVALVRLASSLISAPNTTYTYWASLLSTSLRDNFVGQVFRNGIVMCKLH